METVESMRIVSDEDEILQIFAALADDKVKVLLWQQEEGKERVIIHATLSEVNQSNRVVTLIKANECRDLAFNQEVAFYLREDSSNTLLMAKADLASKKIIEFKLPSEIKTKERRRANRQYFETVQKAYITVESKVDQSKKDFEVTLLDLSRLGAAIKISAQMKKHFEEGNEIKIKQLMNQSVEGDLLAKIVYLVQVEEAQRMHVSKHIRMGVVFNREYQI